MNLVAIVDHHAGRFPDALAFRCDDECVTYSQLAARVRISAAVLASVGVWQGDVVGILARNSLEYVEVMLATAYLGAIFMPLNWRLAGPELAYIIEHSTAKIIVTEQEFQAVLESSCRDLQLELLMLDQPRDSANSYVALCSNAVAPPAPAEIEADDLHRLMYTSGTTARPKGVMITYSNLFAKCAAHAVELEVTRCDRGLAVGPLYHVGALDLSLTTMLYVGASTSIKRGFEAAVTIDAIEREKITTTWLAPAMIKLLLAEQALSSRDLSSMRVIVDGGEKMPLPLIESVLKAFPNAWFADAYGLTETVSGDTFLDKGRVQDKLGSVGKPVLHLEVRVVDAEEQDAPIGEVGEIVLRGPKVFSGYWRDEHATTEAFRGGWFHTGDIGFLDEDGYLWIVDRLKDMVISGGENIASSELERVLHEHPEVAEAAVVARPDPRWGEVPVAYVAIRPGARLRRAI